MSDYTPGPWVQFAIDGKPDAIMPAGREGDICTFRQPPSDADAVLMTLAPLLVKALEKILRANDDFVSAMPNEYEGDSLTDACDEARALLAPVNHIGGVTNMVRECAAPVGSSPEPKSVSQTEHRGTE